MEEGTHKSDTAKREEEILAFWKEKDIFKKSLEKESPQGEFIFYEGPPTANGKPGIHHLEARSFKDVILRYKTMRGYHVRRKGGWDTHGLPVELQVEKELGLQSKKDIEEYGVAAFNKKCKESVWQYVELWEKFTDRIGYWVDQENPYITYETSYIESVWNIFKKISEKDLLYKDYRVVPWCPRCGTALSSHELAQGYKDVKDLSVYVKLKIKGFDGAYFLAWTTTPWTLPGNVALAVGKDIEYVEAKVGDEILVLAKERLSLLESEYKIVAEHKGEEMVGMEYEPLYPFIQDQKDMEGLENAFKVYIADFVNTEDGTGIVHTAVMYGQDDFELGTKVGLPKYHLVNEDGHFKDGLDFLSGKFVKDEETAVDIIKDLAHRNLLFKKEKYEHSYPHCWRCKTSLIYYARDSWYIRMSDLRDKLVKENENINWEPSHIKEGRFGEWIREVKDWAISRERYWGTPMPVWQDMDGNRMVIGGVDDLKKYLKPKNTYYVMRHGESDHNVGNFISNDPNNNSHLTENGKEQVRKATESLKDIGFTKIFVSHFSRTKETVEIVSEVLGISKDNIVIDERLGELRVGDSYEGKTIDEYHAFFTSIKDRFKRAPEGGEMLTELVKRAGEFLYSFEAENTGEKVLIISHEATINAMHMVTEAKSIDDAVYIKQSEKHNPKTGEVSELVFWPAPHNEDYFIDLHKPYIDDVKLVDEDGKEFTRVKEVMDVWFDSGAMPFAQDHYPFENKDWVENKGFPADYISEAIDQTRGWFYTLHAIGVLMDRGNAYKNVICLGHILDEEGKKMSKSLGNIVDPWLMADKYGIDAVRLWMYSVNQPGESKNFDEETVDEIVKKVFNLIKNSHAFYELYADDQVVPRGDSDNVLDKWILSRFYELVKEGQDRLDAYKIFEAARMLRDFANDLSTWYIRRSRDRFKSDREDKQKALETTRFVLRSLAQYMAPFTPFFAEDLYQKVREFSDPESVHVDVWPEAREVDMKVLENMEIVRTIVSDALRLRAEKKVKIRQPLASLSIKEDLSPEYLELIKDEVNVKEVKTGQGELFLDTEITEELKKEGRVRDVIRLIQDERKQNNFVPSDVVGATFDTSDELKGIIEEFAETIQKETGLKDIEFKGLSGEKRKIDDLEIGIELEK